MIKRIIKIAITAFVIGLVALAFTLSKESGIQVTEEPSATTAQTVSIHLAGTGTIRIDGVEVAVSALTQLVNQRIVEARSSEGLQFQISTAKDADNMLLIQVMDAIRKGGATSIVVSGGSENAN